MRLSAASHWLIAYLSGFKIMQMIHGYPAHRDTNVHRDPQLRMRQRRENDDAAWKFGLRGWRRTIQILRSTTRPSQKPLAVRSRVSLPPYLTHDHESANFEGRGKNVTCASGGWPLAKPRSLVTSGASSAGAAGRTTGPLHQTSGIMVATPSRICTRTDRATTPHLRPRPPTTSTATVAEDVRRRGTSEWRR